MPATIYRRGARPWLGLGIGFGVGMGLGLRLGLGWDDAYLQIALGVRAAERARVALRRQATLEQRAKRRLAARLVIEAQVAFGPHLPCDTPPSEPISEHSEAVSR
jgi:hypothetical protein